MYLERLFDHEKDLYREIVTSPDTNLPYDLGNSEGIVSWALIASKEYWRDARIRNLHITSSPTIMYFRSFSVGVKLCAFAETAIVDLAIHLKQKPRNNSNGYK